MGFTNLYLMHLLPLSPVAVIVAVQYVLIFDVPCVPLPCTSGMKMATAVTIVMFSHTLYRWWNWGGDKGSICPHTILLGGQCPHKL